METNRLMIGDWVLHDGEPYQIRQLGIYGENRDGEDYPAVCIGKPKGIGLIVERKEIEPIPTTPEILEKNGFVKDNCGEMTLELDDALGTTEIVLVPSYNEGYYWWKVSNELITKIKSIHELQHALRLCGINKEITI